MACWWSSCIFSTPFLVSHFTKATALGFLERAAISIALSKLIKISWGFFALPRMSVTPVPYISDLKWTWCDENLKLSLIFLMPRYFPKSALLNKGWFCSWKSVSIAPAGALWNKSRLIFIIGFDGRVTWLLVCRQGPANVRCAWNIFVSCDGGYKIMSKILWRRLLINILKNLVYNTGHIF